MTSLNDQILRILMTVVCASLVTLPAQAETSASEPAASSLTLEEIVVTAQRREERVQDVPISVTALDTSFIADNGIRNIEDLSGFAPSLYTTNSVNYGAAPVSIRGIGGANGGGNFFNDEPVGVYYNDMYVGRLSFSTSDLLDVESLQVLRGPQGTLFGRNATAGALLIQTVKPTEQTEAYVRLKVAEDGEQRIAGALSGSLGRGVQARLSAAVANRDGWGDNEFNGADVNGSEDTTLRLSLAFQPSDSVNIDVMLERQDQEATPATINVASVAPLTPSSPFVERPDFDDDLDDLSFSFNDVSENDSDATNAIVSVNWDLGSITLDSITAYREYNLDGAQDSDSTEFRLFNNFGDIGSEQFSQEIRLSSNTASALSWTAGLYYFSEDTDMRFAINNFQALFGAGTNAAFDARQELDSWAVFADASYALNEQFTLTVGGRYSDEEKDFANDLTVLTIQNSIPLPVPVGPFPVGSQIPGGIPFQNPPLFTSDADFDNFSPRIVLDYTPSNDVLAYLSFSRGFKSGGFNSFGLATAFDDEEVDAYEIGLKSTLFDGRVRLNAAYFMYDYSNLQVRLPVPTGGVSIVNAGEADVSGFELEATFSATERLRFDFNISVLDTELTRFNTQQVPDNLIYLLGAPIPLETVNADGNELTRAPELSYYLSGIYSLPLGENYTADLKVSYRYQDEAFFLETNQTQDTFRSDDSERLDVRLTLAPRSKKWEASLYVLNATDDRSITQVTALGSFPNAALSRPQQFGAEFLYHWE